VAEDLPQLLDSLVRRRLAGEGVGGVARLSAGATQEIWRFHMLKDGAEIPLILRRAPGSVSRPPLSASRLRPS